MDILTEAVRHLAADDYTRVSERTLRRRADAIRRTHIETRLEEAYDRFLEEVRERLLKEGEYGPEEDE